MSKGTRYEDAMFVAVLLIVGGVILLGSIWGAYEWAHGASQTLDRAQ